MINKTIVQKASAKTMQKLILCSFIFILGFTQASAAEEEAVAAVTSAYVSLGDPMVLNLSSSRRLTFLQISADVLLSDAAAEETVKTHVPAIRHSLILLLSEQKVGDMKSPDKREEIRQQVTARVKGLIAELSGSQDVSEVLFSNILVQ